LKILAIDTTSEQGSIAITEGDLVVEEVALESGDGYGHVLFGAIENLLERNGLRLADIDGFASASGPGTFTGVRVGLTAIKGFAEAMGRKVIAVSNLKAIALAGTFEFRAPVLDARRGDIYGAVYNSALEMNQDEVVMKYDAWVASLPAGAEILHGKGLLAGAIGRIAAREFAAGSAVDPALIDANYVRRADAEMFWTDVT
jgi:tRNA threonylcarbamoyladenosine biosynthesis protein TsaB